MCSRCVPNDCCHSTSPINEMREILRQKAHDLFTLCDEGGKGFASKRDMYRLTSELPLSPAQLDEVFDALDRDKNGCLTLQEFTEGLGMFLGVDCQLFQDEAECVDHVAHRSETTKEEQEEDDEQFEDFLDQLGANSIFRDEDYIRHMWDKVKKDDPLMLDNFERFLGKVTQELKNTKNDYSTLESTLKARSVDHEEQVQALYTEMEEQLQAEVEVLLAKERSKEQKIRNELETELQQKDKYLHELMTEHEEMEKQLEQLNALDSETRQQNTKLQKERDTLEQSLLASEKMLKGMQNHLELLRQRSIQEKRRRAKAAFKVSEDIALEREGLVKQLQDLKKVNKQLIDEKDELLLSAANTPINMSDEDSSPSGETIDHDCFLPTPRGKIINSKPPNSPSRRRRFENLRTDLGSLPATSRASNSTQTSFDQCHQLERTTVSDDPLFVQQQLCKTSPPIPVDGDKRLAQTTPSQHDRYEGMLKSEDECEVDDHFFVNDPKFLGLPEKDRLLLQNNLNITSGKDARVCNKIDADSKGNLTEDYREIAKNSNSCTQVKASYSPRTRRKNEAVQNEQNNSAIASLPERVFKIVLIGDSGVGKTSIVYRFCSDSFKATFNATVGVDFQVQTVVVEGRLVVLQIWDTAGQERFRSITQQYYRKADGIIIVYDVTSENSFKNVRNWMVHVQENADDNVVLMLIGNKIDLCDSDENRVVKTKHGSRLADEYGTLFYETSAKNGDSVEEAMEALACLLQDKEDEVMERVLRLQDDTKPKKKKCCR